jgi:Ca2+-transporting ATPase
MVHPTTQSIETLVQSFSSSITQGLAAHQIEQARSKFGENILEEHGSFSLLRSLIKELKSPLAVVLIIAGLISFFLNDIADAFVILLALLINLGVGLWQEGRAAHVFALLQKETQHTALVIRNGVESVIPSVEVVVGDILVLTGGTRISADARVIEIHELAANESALTGEWTAQKKTVVPLPENTRSQDMTNMVWAGTYVAEGHGRALVISVGEKTMFGSLALSATELIERPTPLQDKLNSLARTILMLVAFISACIFALGLMRGLDASHMLLVSLAVGIAAMPEGLPAVMTVVLAQAMQHILKKGGLVKRLVSAETFGSVTTIITDKTGTLTTGEMTFSGIVSADGVDDAKSLSTLDIEVLSDAVRASDAFIEEVEGKVARSRLQSLQGGTGTE